MGGLLNEDVEPCDLRHSPGLLRAFWFAFGAFFGVLWR